MSPSADLKARLIRDLRAWIAASALTHQAVADLLDIDRSSVGRLERFSSGALLDLWVKSGGLYKITLGRDSPR